MRKPKLDLRAGVTSFAKQLLSRPAPEPSEHTSRESAKKTPLLKSDSRPKQFGLSGATLSSLNPEECALIAAVVAGVIDRNLDMPHDPRYAELSSGETSIDMFKYVGVEWLELLIKYGRLAEDHAVLDIGSGAGRMAFPISMYLHDTGSYVGFDPVEASVQLCKAHITRQNFRFLHVDLHHHIYRPQGTIMSDGFEFPCEDASIDTALAASVFTHIDLNTAKRYLRETKRVMKIGGRAIFSIFALTNDMLSEQGSITPLLGTSRPYAWRFRHRGEGFYTHCDELGNPRNDYVPDKIGDPIAYHLEAFTNFCMDAGLTVVEFLPGAWCGRKYVHGYQDMIVLQS